MSHSIQQIVRVNFIYINLNRFIYSLNLKEAARKMTAKSYAPMEVLEHYINLVSDENKKEEKKDVIPKADQIENDVLLKSNTTGEERLILEKIPSKLSFHNLLTVQTTSNTILKNEKQPTVAIDNNTFNKEDRAEQQMENKQKDAKTQVFERKKRKENCGCYINNPLMNCSARNHKEKAHVEFEFDANNKYDDDEGYNTARLSKSAGTSTNVKDITSKDNFSLDKQNVSSKKVSETSQTSAPKFPVPMTINYSDSTPVKMNLEDSEVIIPTTEFNSVDMNNNLMDVKKMASIIMQNQLALLNNLKSNYTSDINDNDKKNGSNNEKQKNKVRMENSNLDEFTSPKMSTSVKIQSSDRSNKQQGPSKGLALQPNVANDNEHHMPMRHKNITENVSSVPDKKLHKSEIEETDRRSKSPQNRFKDINREEKNNNDENLRNCQMNKCRRCPLGKKISTRTSSRRSVNAETQSSQTQVEAGTSYSYVDAIQSSPRKRRKNKTQSPESSLSPHKDRSTRSKFNNEITNGPAKGFLVSTSSFEEINDESSSRHTNSKSTENTQNSNKQYQSRSRPSTRERVTQQSQLSFAKPTTPVLTRDRYHEKFEC